MSTDERAHSRYWIDGEDSCPIGGPFDLWRRNYFREYGKPPEDTAKMYPSLSPETVDMLATLTVNQGRSLAQILDGFAKQGPELELTLAHNYFSQWRRKSPFMPESMQGLALRPARTTPESFEEILDDLRNHNN